MTHVSSARIEACMYAAYVGHFHQYETSLQEFLDILDLLQQCPPGIEMSVLHFHLDDFRQQRRMTSHRRLRTDFGGSFRLG